MELTHISGKHSWSHYTGNMGARRETMVTNDNSSNINDKGSDLMQEHMMYMYSDTNEIIIIAIDYNNYG